jgi:hypothetical protein
MKCYTKIRQLLLFLSGWEIIFNKLMRVSFIEGKGERFQLFGIPE